MDIIVWAIVNGASHYLFISIIDYSNKYMHIFIF